MRVRAMKQLDQTVEDRRLFMAGCSKVTLMTDQIEKSPK